MVGLNLGLDFNISSFKLLMKMITYLIQALMIVMTSLNKELTEVVFKVKVVSCLKGPTKEFSRIYFQILFDIINRIISLKRIQE